MPRQVECSSVRIWSGTLAGWLMLLLWCVVLPWPAQARETTLTAAVLRDFPPLYQLDEQGRPTGFAIDILQIVAEKNGWQLEYRVVEHWDEALGAVRNGEADLVPSIAISPKWAETFLYSEPTEVTPVVCFTRKDSQAIQGCTLDGLTGKRVAAIQQGRAYQWLETHPQITLIPTANVDVSLMQLLSGGADIFIGPRPVVLAKLEEMHLSDRITITGAPLMELKRAMLVRRDSGARLQPINQALKELLQSSEYMEQYQRWYVPPRTIHRLNPWPHATAWTLGGLLLLLLLSWRTGGARCLVRRLLHYAGRPAREGLHLEFMHNRITGWLILGFSIVITILAWYISNLYVEQRAADRFEYKVEEARLGIAKRMSEYEQVLRGGVGLFQAAAHTPAQRLRPPDPSWMGGWSHVTREVWRDYVEALNIDTYWPGIQGIGFALMIPPAERETLIRHIQEEGFSQFTIKPEGERDPTSAILYLEPFEGRNLRAFGFDMYSESVRRAAMERARDTGQPSVSGPVTLVQETSTDVQAGFLMYLPVYRPDWSVHSLEERRQALVGFVYSPFRIKDLMRGILGPGVPELDFEIFDGDQPTHSGLLYTTHGVHLASPSDSRHLALREIQLPGRTWLARFHSRPSFEDQMDSQQPLIVALMGLLVDALLFVIVWSLSGQKERIRSEAANMAEQLSEAETRYRQIFVQNQAVALVIDPESGAIQDANLAAQAFYGYPLDELTAMKITQINTFSMERVAQEMKNAATEQRNHFYFKHRLASGEVRDVEVYSGPIVIQGKRLLLSIIHDISERKRAEDQLNQTMNLLVQSEARLNAILHNTHAIIFLKDTQSRYLLVNQRFCDLFHVTPEEILHKTDDELFSPEFARQLQLHDHEVIQHRRRIEVEETVPLEDGLHTYLSLKFPIQPHANAPLVVGGIATDITHIKRSEQALREAMRSAEEANQAKSAFLANMSHEIRTPLNAVIGMTEMIRETPLNEEQQQYLRVLDSAGASLLAVINDVLDMSRIESGLLTLEHLPFSLREHAESAVAMVSPRARAKGIPIHTRLDSLLPDLWRGDGGRVRQILLNLLSNAVKFTEQGQIQLEIRQESDAQGALLHLIVADSGIGIPDEQCQAIFDRFVQSDASIVRRFGGTGLGLAICRSLAEMMGGRIWVESTLGQGSTFHVQLRLQAYEGPVGKAAEALERSSHAPGGMAPLRIMIADDAEDNRFLMQAFLKETPHELTFVEDGVQAVASFVQRPFDLVLMDVQMPNLDGLEATRRIRRWEEQHARPPTPILALTADALTEHVERSLEAGCDAHITKPIHKKKLLEEITRWSGIRWG